MRPATRCSSTTRARRCPSSTLSPGWCARPRSSSPCSGPPTLDYHVEAECFLYSVPHALIREQVDVRLTSRTVEVFHRGQRVAAHQRRFGGRRHGTDPDHMPRAHRRYAEWTQERVQRWARAIGPNTEGLVIAVLAS